MRKVLFQASAALGVRAWHNERPEPFQGTSAHPAIEIAWSDGGPPPRYVVSSRALAPSEVCAIVVPARMEHLTTLPAGARARVVALDDATIAEVADAMGVRPEVQLSVTSAHSRVVRICKLLFEEALGRADGHDLAVAGLTEALAVELLRADSTPAPAPARDARATDLRIRRALVFIGECHADPLSLDAIARVAGMSRYHFGRLFEAQVGKSPYRHVIDVRVERAAALLRTGRVSVTEAAITVGFNDGSRFARAFRARLGITPSAALAAGRSGLNRRRGRLSDRPPIPAAHASSAARPGA